MAGARLPYHYNPFSQSGGLMHYPLSGVFSGTVVSLSKSSYLGGDSDIEINVSAGEIILDSTRFEHPGFTGLTLPSGEDLGTVDKEFTIWLNPVRKVVISTEMADQPGAPEEGELFVKTTSNKSIVDGEPDYQIVETIYVYKNGAWEPSTDTRDIPYTRGNQNEYSMNGVVSGQATFSIEREPDVYHSTKQRPYLSQKPNVKLRHSGSIQLAKVYFDGAGAATVTEEVGRNYRIRI